MGQKFGSLKEVQEWANDHTAKEIVAYWNALPGVKQVSRFQDRQVAAMRIWKACAQPVVEAPKARTQGAEPKAKKAASKRTARPVAPTKANEKECRVDAVLALLRRKGGATLCELQETFGWLPHTTRGFISRLGSAGHKIHSEKVEGQRTYSIAA